MDTQLIFFVLFIVLFLIYIKKCAPIYNLEFVKGDMVICIDNNGDGYDILPVTIGKQYKILDIYDKYIIIRNDQCISQQYFWWRFQ